MKKKLTKEERKRLLGFLPVSKNGIPYTPKVFEGLDDIAPKIMIKGWTTSQRSSFESEINQDKKVDFNKLMAKYAYMGIVEISNVIDLSTEEEIVIENLEDFSELPVKLIADIFKKVQEISGLAKEEEEGLE